MHHRDYAAKSEEQQAVILQKLDLVQDHAGTFTSTSRVQDEDTTWNAPGDALIASIVSSLKAEPPERLKRAKELRSGILQRIHSDSTGTRVGDATDSSFQPMNLSQDRETQLQATFLASFVYRSMDDRHSGIINAHKETFRWIFERRSNDSDKDEKWSNFDDWLRSDDQLYWITGKAGSGKSTLMKYICGSASENEEKNHEEELTTPFERCQEGLQEWAGGRSVIIASFYFWASGNELEASPKGLYLSLIFQILQHYPELIPRVAPTSWEAMSLFGEKPPPMTEPELEALLRLVVLEAQKERNICLFIDGLDEFSGESNKLVDLIEIILRYPKVKVCVSSRPWLVFEDAFQNKPSLKLEDLTYKDIRCYIAENFAEDAGYRRLAIREPQYASQLEDNIAQKAIGVFLWVSLVVKSLLSGMRNDDRVSDIQRRLDQLPQELESLYSSLLNSLDPFYFGHAAQYFRLMEIWGSPDAILLSFSDEDIKRSIQPPIREYSQAELSELVNTIRRRINSRCRGLLEVTSPRQLKGNIRDFGSVQYFHRTVKDYISTPQIFAKFREATPDLDCQICICSANLLAFKTVVIKDGRAAVCGIDDEHGNGLKGGYQEIENLDFNDMSIYAWNCLRAASKTRQENTSAMIVLLDSLCQASENMIGNDKARLESFYNRVEPQSTHTEDHTMKGSSFLSLTVRLGVTEYVRGKASFGCVVPFFSRGIMRTTKVSRIKSFVRTHRLARSYTMIQAGEEFFYWPLLMDSLSQYCPKLDMVSLCLEKGADVNFKVYRRAGNSRTVWEHWIDRLMNEIKNDAGPRKPMTREAVIERLKPILPATKKLIENGACVHNVIAITRTGKYRELPKDRDAKAKLLYDVLRNLKREET